MDSAALPYLMTTPVTLLRATWVRTWIWKGTLLQVRATVARVRLDAKMHGENLSGRSKGVEGLMNCRLGLHPVLTCTFCCTLAALSPCVVSSSLSEWHMQMNIVPDSTTDLYNLQVSPMPSTSEGLYLGPWPVSS